MFRGLKLIIKSFISKRMMKNYFFFIVTIILFTIAGAENVIADNEIALFDSNGKAIAYIAVDDDFTIYLWEGKPVAYIYSSENIYGFNGKHLGWFEDGIIWDHEGYAVGAIKGAVKMLYEFEPFKGFKEFKPFKSFREFSPYKPRFKNKWSGIPLSIFFKAGVN